MCTAMTAALIHSLYGIDDWNACFMIGAMLSATDPVAVVALMKELGASSRLSTLIEGESLLNDGTSIVIFNVFKDAVTGEGAIEAGPVAAEFVQLAFGGVGVGLLIAVITVFLLGRIHNDVSGEITLTLVAAFGTFIVAESFKTSGVLALVALGLYMSAYGRLRVEPAVEHVMEHFWELAGYFANTIVFFISGIIVVQRGVTSEDIGWNDVGLLLVVYVALHFIRGFMLICASPILARMGYGFDWKTGAALGYGGLRGAVGLTLAMIVEEDERIDEMVRSKAIFLMSGIAVLTLLINGTTVGWLLKKIGLITVSSASEMAFKDQCHELDTEVETELAKILEHNRFLGGVTNKSSMAQVFQYLSIHTEKTYNSRKEKFGDFTPAPRLQGRWKRYDELYNEASPRFVSTEREMTASVDSVQTQTNPITAGNRNHTALSLDDFNDDQKKELLGEMRTRFVRALKTQIWVLIEQGFIDSAHGGLLLGIVEQQLDKDLVEQNFEDGGGIQTFPLIKVMIDKSIVNTLSSKTFVQLLNQPGLRSMLKEYVHGELGSLFALMSGFVMAHEHALHHIVDMHKVGAGAHSGIEHLERGFALQLHKEVMKNTKDFEQYADMYMHDYPQIMMSIKIKAAARVMLAIERHKIEHLHHSGIIDGRECEILQSANNVSTTKVGYHPSSIAVLSKSSFLRGHNLTQTLSEKVIEQLVSSSKEHYYKPEAKLLTEGTASEEWMIIVSGTVRCVHEAKDGVDEELLRLEGPNAVVGANGVLTGNPRGSTVFAQSFVQAYFWTTDTSMKLMVEYPELGLALWQSVALFVCEVCVSPFEGIEPSALMAMVRQGELWSHSKSPAKVYAAACEAASSAAEGNNSSSGSVLGRAGSRFGASKKSMARMESKKAMGGMKDLQSPNRAHSDPEEITLTTYGLLLTGAIQKVGGSWMKGYRLIHPGSYLCNDATTIMRLKVLLPECEEALRLYEWDELDEADDNLDGRSSRYSVAHRQSVSRGSLGSVVEEDRTSGDGTGGGALGGGKRASQQELRELNKLKRKASISKLNAALQSTLEAAGAMEEAAAAEATAAEKAEAASRAKTTN